MSCHRWAWFCAAALLLFSGLVGCVPGGDSQADDEREPHYLMGRKLVGQLDYDGAVDAYEKALLVNPQSASAHFELAWLYEDKENDPAAAIYHYERFLKLSPNSGKADIARDHINSCKLQLAKTASAIAPISAAAQRDLEKLVEENRDLKAQLAQWQAYYASHPPAPATNGSSPALSSQAQAQPQLAGPGSQDSTPPPALASRSGIARVGASTNQVQIDSPAFHPSARTHTIASGDTLASIARKYGVSVDTLRAANPQVEPRHLRVGSALAIPGA